MTKKFSYKITFINEASRFIGMGHILRSQVLASIIYTRGYSISGITIGDKEAVSYTNERMKYENFKWPIKIVQDQNACVEIVMRTAPSMIVLDCSSPSQHIILACKRFGIPVLALDYFSSLAPLPETIINLIDHNTDTLSGYPPIRKGSTYYEGSQYAIIREEFNSARESRISRIEPVLPKKIVITFGGADPSGNSKRALEILAKWPGEFLVDLIIGPLYTLDIESTINAIQNCKIFIHKSPTYISKLFELADLLFCGGGGTLLEAIYIGIPTIVIAQNEAEYRHANSLANRKACWMLESINWEIISLMENRNERSKYSRDCVDGLGAKRICEVIEQQLNKT